ncbi:hypothetical protein Tel_07930 [Candidatus Tenderia electrophaga]|jgi:hypothetical protein|uniref:Lipase n=1 Tax=Candidatus Tenderia electrophaga TaxID=1748243 RepID=A0A0S2TD85_9GAMM|nr:hypothetical protein Tel_07930 [Candidatus Tenderia electrophaga]
MDMDMEDRGNEPGIWRRGLFMLLFAVCLWVAKFVAAVVIVFQFFNVVITGSVNEKLLWFGQSLSLYHYQVLRFLTFNSEEHPYPLGDWPAGGSPLFEED